MTVPRQGPTRVLISEPPASSASPYLPYVWAVLKSYYARHGAAGDAIEWLRPINQRADSATLMQSYTDASIDVLGLSCYTWNWELQCRIAEHAKRQHPDCLVVAGGPHPDCKDPEFFLKHPYLDLVVDMDGEIAFTEILNRVARGNRDFHDIPGLWIPAAGRAAHALSGRAQVPVTFVHSPYLDNHEYLEALVASHPNYSAVLETNRGCPYSCSFCDWGGGTMSKVRRFDMDRIRQEVDWIARMGLRFAMLVDANFGILPRDLEIADLINEAKAKYGYPLSLYYSPAKNNPDRSIEIARKFFVSGIAARHSLAIQHTSLEVLSATARDNISPEKQIQVVKALAAEGIPTDAQLITGMPGDTYELWKNAFGDLMEWGVHDNYQVFSYHLLPNAPAADEDYIRKWQIGTVERFVSHMHTPSRPRNSTEGLLRSRLIVESRTYSRQDWVRMRTWATFIRVLHNSSLMRLIAIYLRSTHDVPYRSFYELVIDDFFARETTLHQSLIDHHQRYLDDPEAVDDLAVEQLPGFSDNVEPADWLHAQICFDIDSIFERLAGYLADRYPSAASLRSVVDYQRNVIILPNYDREAGKSFVAEHDWVGYFEAARSETRMPEPQPVERGIVDVTDWDCGEGAFLAPLDWNKKDGEDRTLTWLRWTVMPRRSIARSNFQRVRLRASQLEPDRLPHEAADGGLPFRVA